MLGNIVNLGLNHKMLYEGVEHEVNNALAALKSQSGRIKSLSKRKADDSLSQGMKSIAQTLDSIGNKIASSFRLLGGLAEKKSDFNVRAMVNEVLAENSLPTNGIKVNIKNELEDTTKIKAFRSVLQHVLSNYIRNAYKAIVRKHDGKLSNIHSNQEQEAINIAIKRENNGNVTISVGDTGAAISKDAEGKIFNSNVASKDGQGIGLLFMKKLAKCYGVDLNFTAQPKEFKLSFPCELAASTDNKTEVQDSSVIDINNKQIAFLEDDEGIVDVYQFSLEDRNNGKLPDGVFFSDRYEKFESLLSKKFPEIVVVDMGEIPKADTTGGSSDAGVEKFKSFYHRICEIYSSAGKETPEIVVTSGSDFRKLETLCKDQYSKLKAIVRKGHQTFIDFTKILSTPQACALV